LRKFHNVNAETQLSIRLNAGKTNGDGVVLIIRIRPPFFSIIIQPNTDTLFGLLFCEVAYYSVRIEYRYSVQP